ncbi:MAG: hypothetical protein JOZ99_06090 [Actinobacteria bacterium]|nr:hypothetical protein [Actinomycetota bacterium]
MATIEEHDSFRLVGADVIEGLGAAFEPVEEDTFTVTEAFSATDAITTDAVAAVPWEYRCVHAGAFQGLFPTGRELRIPGVTLVDYRGEEPMFARYVDWAAVIEQLGLTVSWRVPVDEEQYRQGLEALGLATGS